MIRWTISGLMLGLVLGLLLSGTRAADRDERYTIRLKEVGDGDSVNVTQSFSGENRTRLREVEKVEKMTATASFRETILDKKRAEPATRLKRHYRKAQVTRNDRPQDVPYAGKTVLIEKKAGKYRFALEDGAELKTNLFNMDRELNEGFDLGPQLGKSLLPAAAVRVGDEWSLDKKKLLERLLPISGLRMDLARTRATAKLVRVYTKEKARFGVLSFHLEAPATQMAESGLTLDLEAGSKLSADGVLDLCIDGTQASGTSKVTMRVKILTLVKATGATVHGDIHMESEETRTELPRK